MLIKCSTIFQVHHGQPGGDVHGAADAVQQDVRHGPGAEDGWARRGPVTAQTRIRTAPVSKACSIFFTLILLLVIFSLFSVILCGPGRHIHLPPQLQFGTVLRFYCSQWSRARRGRVKIRAEIAQFSQFFSPSFPSIHPRLWPAADGLNVKYSGLLRASVPIIFIINNKWNYFHRKENNLSLKARIKAN